MSFWIVSSSIHTNFLPLFLSIALCLKENGYKIYFIEPNILQKHFLNKHTLPFCKEDEIDTKDIKKILVWNGLSHDIKLTWVQNYYFENGYFGNDLQIFKNWVNALSEIKDIPFDWILQYKSISPTKQLTNTNIITHIDLSFYNYWILGFFSQGLIISCKHFTRIMKNKRENSHRKKILQNTPTLKLPEGKYIIIGFQVHDDTQIIHNSEIVHTMDDILNYFYDDIHRILPEHKIIVKEHPMDIARIDYSHLQKKYPEVVWIQKWDIWDYIDISEYLICVNSSIWLQALSKYKKVLTLWDNFYSNNPWSENIKKREDFVGALAKLKAKDLLGDKKLIDAYIKVFKEKIFVSNGWWKDFKQETVLSICERLI